MVNVGNGNLIVQSTDIDVRERGLDLAFRRTYNSSSLNDTNANSGNDDGSPNENVYGNGWTNTFDTHLAVNTSGGVSVFDVDGARYDYTPNGTGCLTPPAGVHAVLCWDNGCGYFLTKTTGTVYHYWAPSFSSLGSSCVGWGSSNAAYQGRLYMIMARNWNNWIQLTYSWLNGDASTSNNLTQIVAAHADGQQLTFSFEMVNGRPLLTSITRPGGAQVTYSYNGGHDLVAVNKLSNGSADSLPEDYGYYAADKLAWTSNPRWNVSGGTDGSFTNFYYDGNNRINRVLLYGFANIVPADGTGTAIQSAYGTGGGTIADATFAYPTSGETTVTDVDGHSTEWNYDSLGRVTQTQQWTASASNLWLVTSASWDSNNNLIETVDPRGYATDYAWDSNGNVTAIALPTVTTSQGTFRPTTLYAYDRSNGANNLIASCDPVRTHALGLDWTGNPGTSDSLCPNTLGSGRYTWNYGDSAQQFGFLSDSYTPLGYHVSFQYNNASQGGDNGLLTDAIADCVTQNDGSNLCAHQTFTYDGYGNLTSSDKGYGAWNLTYDSLNRLITVRDPDSPNYVSYRYYYSDGSLQKTETAYQHATGTGVTFSYDPDGNLKQSSSYHGGSYVNGGAPTLPAAVPTNQFYDGEDRLVEVQQPRDSTFDSYTGPWITRYFYDLSQQGTVGPQPSFGGQSFSAYGNLFKTEELLPGTDTVTLTSGGGAVGNAQPEDIRGYAFDALDRVTKNYMFVLQNGVDTVSTASTSYDNGTAYSSNNYGEVASTCDALGHCTYNSYDNTGAPASVTYSASTDLNRTIQFDPDGRIASVNSPTFGTQSFAYDGDGRTTQSVEPTGGGVTSPATLNYHYYSNGLRSSVDVVSSALSQAALFSYSYRNDGKAKTQQINLPSDANVGTTTLSFTYSAAGRPQQRTESGTGASSTPVQYHYDPSYGSLNEIDVPAGNESAMEYDPSGALLGDLANGSQQTNNYTVRGELTTTTNLYGSNSRTVANGVTLGWPRLRTGQTSSLTIDPRMGVMVGNSSGDSTCTTTTSFSFDLAGRLGSEGSSQDGSGDTCFNSSSLQRTYDQVNHVATSQYNSSDTATYNWGPNGHPIRIGETSTSTTPGAGGSAGVTAYETLHWDGNQLLFTTNAYGQLDDVKVGTLGDITPLDSGYNGITFWDRDPSGSVVYCHNATGAAGDGLSNPNMQSGIRGTIKKSPCTVGTGQTMNVPSSVIWFGDAPDATNRIGWYGVLGMPRTDGFTDGFDTIQGVRSFDSTLGAWTAPDAYGGQVGDPMSEKSYVWNRGDAAGYSDSSGFSASKAIIWGLVGAAAGFLILGAVTGGAGWGVGAVVISGEMAELAGTAAVTADVAEIAGASIPGGEALAATGLRAAVPYLRVLPGVAAGAGMAARMGAVGGGAIGFEYGSSLPDGPGGGGLPCAKPDDPLPTIACAYSGATPPSVVHGAKIFGGTGLGNQLFGYLGAIGSVNAYYSNTDYCWSCSESSTWAPAGNAFPGAVPRGGIPY